MLRTATKFAPSSQQAFQLAYEAGFRCAEFWLGPDLIDNWRSIVAFASEFPMDYALHFPNRGQLTDQHLQSIVDLYRALDCTAMVIHQPMYDRFGKELLQQDPYLKLGIENHNLPHEAALWQWAEESPWLTLDVEHLWIYTVNNQPLKKLRRCVKRLLRQFGEKLIHVHLPGYLPGYPIHRPQYCSRKMVMQMFTMLADAEFDGLVVSETMNKFQNAEELQMDVLLHRHWQNRYRAKQFVDCDRLALV